MSDAVNKEESEKCLAEMGFTGGEFEYLHLLHLQGQIPMVWVTEHTSADLLDVIIS